MIERIMISVYLTLKVLWTISYMSAPHLYAECTKHFVDHMPPKPDMGNWERASAFSVVENAFDVVF